MPNVIVYSTQNCSYCLRAKELLKGYGVEYTDAMIDQDPKLLEEMLTRSGRKTVPQIFIGDRHVGGYDDLYALHTSGELKQLLST